MLYNEESQGTTKLAPGEYVIRWETHSPEATVTFLRNRKVAGKLMGKVVEHDRKYEQNVIVDGPGPDGSCQLMEID